MPQDPDKHSTQVHATKAPEPVRESSTDWKAAATVVAASIAAGVSIYSARLSVAQQADLAHLRTESQIALDSVRRENEIALDRVQFDNNLELEGVRSDNQLALRRLQAELDGVRSEQEVRFSRLHEERADRIRELWQDLVTVENGLRSFLNLGSPVGILPDFVGPDSMVLAVREFSQRSRMSQVYFGDELVATLGSTSDVLEDTWRDVESALTRSGWADGQYNAGDWANPWEHAEQALAQVNEALAVNLPQAEGELRDEFRAILGVMPGRLPPEG